MHPAAGSITNEVDMRDVEQIKKEIAELIREAALQGVAIRSIRAEFIDCIDRIHLSYIEVEESRR